MDSEDAMRAAGSRKGKGAEGDAMPRHHVGSALGASQGTDPKETLRKGTDYDARRDQALQ